MFYNVDLRRVVGSEKCSLKADGLSIQGVSNTGLTVFEVFQWIRHISLTLFQICRISLCIYPRFSRVLFTSSFYTVLFESHWLLSHITFVETMDSSKRGMNPVAMTIINPRKESLPSQGLNQGPPVLNSCPLPTALCGLGIKHEKS